MKNLMVILLLASLFAPLAFAASDCARNCCDSYNGVWDDDFDSCRSPSDGYDPCVSNCEYYAIATGPTGPDQSQTTHYNCCSTAFVLAAFAGALFLHRE